jgi:hypothetical protein
VRFGFGTMPGRDSLLVYKDAHLIAPQFVAVRAGQHPIQAEAFAPQGNSVSSSPLHADQSRLVVEQQEIAANIAADERAAEGVQLTQRVMTEHSHHLKALRKETYVKAHE